VLLTGLLVALCPTSALEGGQKPGEAVEKAAKEKSATPDKTAGTPELPFQIQLLESHIRFEDNGDSRKEVHTIVKINNVLGAHQFARLTFDYNRAFQQVEIPLVRISHANGGTSELLPSAVTDAANPAVEKFPAYQDVRVKSVRILGLEEGDTIEYRVITTTTKNPLGPYFSLDHTFDRSGQVLEERYELDLPASRFEESEAERSRRLRSEPFAAYLGSWRLKSFLEPQPRTGIIYVSEETPETSREKSGEGDSSRLRYVWEIHHSSLPEIGALSEPNAPSNSDVVVTTFFAWEAVAAVIEATIYPQIWKGANVPAIAAKREELIHATPNGMSLENVIYNFVTEKITTVDLPLELMGYHTRPPSETLASGYGTPADKAALISALAFPTNTRCGLSANSVGWRMFQLPRPTILSHLILRLETKNRAVYSDPELGVAPFGMIPSDLRGKDVFFFYSPRLYVPIQGPEDYYSWQKIPNELPFAAFQKVGVDASLGMDGKLSAKVKYTLRGDNELLLRVAFHQTPKERWKDVAGLLAISDGFRGQVTSVNVSDPKATKDPFTVEYEITQPKFVDWSKKPVRIPALLPQIGLPDLPAKQAAGEAAHGIELGTPLDVDTQMTLTLPPGTKVEVPVGTAVDRDYAKFSSKYAVTANMVTASRRVNFLLRKIPGDRAMDYNAFVRAVQNDQAQMITLVPAADEGKAASSTPKQ